MGQGNGNQSSSSGGKVLWIFRRKGAGGGGGPSPYQGPSLFEELARVVRNIKIRVLPEPDLVYRQDARPWAVYSLLGLFLAVHGMLGLFYPPMYGPDGGPYAYFLQSASFSWKALGQGEIWRLGSATFLHADLGHLTNNVVFFLLLAPLVEREQGTWRFLVYFVAGAVAGLMTHAVLFSTPVIGASAAISGIMGTYPRLYRGSRLRLQIFGSTAFLPIVPLIVLWILLQFLLAMSETGSAVSYVAHLGGFAAGYGLAGRLGRPRAKAPKVTIVYH